MENRAKSGSSIPKSVSSRAPFSSVATLLFINTDQVKPEEMRTAKDLLNPKWRGKISTEDPTTTGAGANVAAQVLP